MLPLGQRRSQKHTRLHQVQARVDLNLQIAWEMGPSYGLGSLCTSPRKNLFCKSVVKNYLSFALLLSLIARVGNDHQGSKRLESDNQGVFSELCIIFQFLILMCSRFMELNNFIYI